MKHSYHSYFFRLYLNPALLIFLLSLYSCLTIRCSKLVSVDPPSASIVTENVYTDDAKATAALVSIYSSIAASTNGYAPGGTQSFTLMAGLSADELINYSTAADRAEFYVNNISAGNTTNLALWRTTYNFIYRANAVLEGLQNATGVTAGTKAQLTGEAKFLRGFFHFYLVNCWGDIPYVSSTDYRRNAALGRTDKAGVYQQIITDLLDAENLLPETYAMAERIRPNKWTARALLARTYLYTGDNAKAAAMATQIINAASVYALVNDPNKVFLKNSAETIWQLQAVVPSYNASEGYNFILTATPSNTSLQPELVNAFDSIDLRRQLWIGVYTSGSKTYYYNHKYKTRLSSTSTEYSVVFRLAEQYLIRAEARAQLNDLSWAAQDINSIRSRAGLPSIAPATQQATLQAIARERRLELFCEWGQRWLDLKRTVTADMVMGTSKAPNWQATDALYPIPLLELQNDQQLTQNPGY